jgi:enoyl-CoA hydratase/carnithine racemase
MPGQPSLLDGRIITAPRGRVLVIGIDRPKRRNGFALKMLREPGLACIAFEQHADAPVALLYAEGAKQGVRCLVEKRAGRFSGK